jgi:NAD(P)H-hydrate epimerase
MALPRGLRASLITAGDMRKAAAKRDEESDKYGHGTVVIVGGSSRYFGAPVLATNSAMQCIAALRVGAGHVRCYVPRSILDLARSFSPNAIVEGLGKSLITFSPVVKRDIERSSVLVLGMGIGYSAQEQEASRKMILCAMESGTKVVADAGAMAAVKAMTMPIPSNVVITPHEKELSRFTGFAIPKEPIRRRIAIAKAAAQEHGVTLVLKGHTTIITDGKNTRLNVARTPALATMGTGDVLCGIIAGYAAIGNSAIDAAAAGVRLHSLIGDTLYGKMGNHIIATDVIDAIPAVARKFERYG